MAAKTHFGFARRHPVWTGLGLALLVLLVALALLLSNLHWVRGPLERVVSSQLEREFRVGHIDLRWGGQPTLRLDDVSLGNLPGGSEPQMARVKAVEVRLSLRDLLQGRVFMPRVAVTDADVLLERLKDGRKNWQLTDDTDAEPEQPPSRVRLGGVSLDRGRVRYLDHQTPMVVTVTARPLDRQTDALAERSDAPPLNDRYALRFEIGGHYRGNTFSGRAESGGVLSLQDTGQPFPLRGEVIAGETRVQMDGGIADAAQLSGVDMRLRIAGPTLANLYPFLLLPLPASPPYALQGRLRRDGGRFALEELGGRIGSTDLTGQGSYVVREPRPLLTVQLRSDLLDITDLGPMIGVETKSRTAKPASQGEVSSREQARASDKRTRGERVLPAGRFDPERLRVIDADVTLKAQRVKGVAGLPLDNFAATLRLHDAVLQLDPLNLGVAGGTMAARATLDARKGDTLHSQLQTELRRLRIDRLVPDGMPLAEGAGLVDLTASLAGSGNSIADAAAKADGRIAMTMGQGRISNLVDAASGLNLGRVLRLLATGDREIALNCGATVFDVKQGQGKSSLFVVDTAQTQVLGAGAFDLEQERFALRVEPKPKVKGLLSLRTPINLEGSFSDVNVAPDKKPLLARAGGALALAAVSPLAALIPLIETGPGKETPCDRVLRMAQSGGTPEQKAPAAAR
jgi:uncharacterized protein involved in outer membrane biogenesis